MINKIKQQSLVVVAFLILIVIVLISFLNQGDLKTFSATEVKLNSSTANVKRAKLPKKDTLKPDRLQIKKEVSSSALKNLKTGNEAQERINTFAEKFQSDFNRARYRTMVSQNANDGAAFAVRVSESLEALNDLKKEKKILLADQLSFLMNCSNQNNKDLPSFVQAYCLRTIEKLGMYEKAAKKAFLIAKRESHPAVQELVGILSSREE